MRINDLSPEQQKLMLKHPIEATIVDEVGHGCKNPLMSEESFDSLFWEHDKRQWISLPDLAQLSGFTRHQLEAEIAQGKIPGARRIGRGAWRIPRDGAEKWFAAHVQQPHRKHCNQ